MGSLGSPHGPCYLQAHGVSSVVQYGISTYMIHPHALLYASLLGPYSLGECLSLIEQQGHTLPLGDIITDPPTVVRPQRPTTWLYHIRPFMCFGFPYRRADAMTGYSQNGCHPLHFYKKLPQVISLGLGPGYEVLLNSQ